VFVIPVLLPRQAFAGHKRLPSAARRLDTQPEALRDVAASVADGRREGAPLVGGRPRGSEITVHVVDVERNLRITVEDNGIGFDPDSVDQQVHFGLALMRERIEGRESSMSIRGWAKVPESLQGFPLTTSSRRAGPRRRPARESLLCRRLVLETEMCATSERKRRQRANRNGEPLDQLHGTSSPPRASCPTGPTMWYSLACRTPIWGTSGLTIGVPLMTLKPQMSPTVLAVGA
jgi:hypothetical protein